MTLLQQDYYGQLLTNPDLEKEIKTALFEKEELSKPLTPDEMPIPGLRISAKKYGLGSGKI